MPGKRTDVISWDEFFMRVAMAAAMRSKDPNTQVGACIADANHRILSVGYNGTPSALNDDEFPWETADDPLLDKHSYVIHAEANAILNLPRLQQGPTGRHGLRHAVPLPRVRQDPRAGRHRRGSLPGRQVRGHAGQPHLQAHP